MRPRTRTTAKVAAILATAAGLAAVATPAFAHGYTPHTVALNGRVTLTDYDSTSANEVCSPTLSVRDTAQIGVAPQLDIATTPRCDEARAKIVVTGTLDWSGNVAISGYVRLEEEDCFLSCGWDHINTHRFTFTLAPGGTRSVSVNIGNGDARVSGTFSLSNTW